jgi:hypothetical protein
MNEGRWLAACSFVLFALSTWPLLLVELPPYQDLPNHLATVTILEHPSLYPELVFNGFLKTNAAMTAWVHFGGRWIGPIAATRAFVVLVLAVSAYAFPRLLLELRGPRAMLVGSFFLVPMVHNWFVSMGMLDFSLALALALLTIVRMQRQRANPTLGGALALATLAILTWYSHVFPLLVVHLVAAIEVLVVAFGKRFAEAVALVKNIVLPILPATALTLAAVVRHFGDAGAVDAYTWHPTPADLLYNLWSEWFYGFTVLSASTIVPCVVLAWLAYKERSRSIPFLSAAGAGALALIFVFAPHDTSNWFYVTSRIAPFLWVAALLRVPDRISGKLATLLGACSIAYSIALGFDFVRLDRERQSFYAGIPYVSERARLLPLIFDAKGSSDNTWHLAQAWGMYVFHKHTAAPLVFASSRSFGLSYREPPPPQLSHLGLEFFVHSMGTPDWLCKTMHMHGVRVGDCEQEWKRDWIEFWHLAAPNYDELLLWGASERVRALVPAEYEQTFAKGRLVLYKRVTP